MAGMPDFLAAFFDFIREFSLKVFPFSIGSLIQNFF